VAREGGAHALDVGERPTTVAGADEVAVAEAPGGALEPVVQQRPSILVALGVTWTITSPA
jgi:hypothetical protein